MVALFPPAQSLAYSYAYVVTHKNKIEKKNKQEMGNQTKSVKICVGGIAAAVAATSGKKE